VQKRAKGERANNKVNTISALRVPRRNQLVGKKTFKGGISAAGPCETRAWKEGSKTDRWDSEHEESRRGNRFCPVSVVTAARKEEREDAKGSKPSGCCWEGESTDTRTTAALSLKREREPEPNGG